MSNWYDAIIRAGAASKEKIMSFDWNKLVDLIIPIVLAPTPLGAAAPWIVQGVHAAEAIKGASGEDKLKHAVEVTKAGIEVANVAGAKIDTGLTDSAIAKGISAAVDIVNIVHNAKGN